MSRQDSDPGRRAAVGNRIAPVRFLAFLAFFPVAFLAYRHLIPAANWKEAISMAFDFAAVCFLVSLIPLLRDSSAAAVRVHARDNDANRVLVLVITSILTLVIMAAIAGELTAAKAGQSHAMVKLAGTLVLIWLFANSVYALHYAHEFYAPGGKDGAVRGGLDFPGTASPTYSDFTYFAFTLGMTFQTSDVQITSPVVRRIALLQSFAAFVFNIGVIAFTINALGGAG